MIKKVVMKLAYKRDDFSEKTKMILANRVCGLCSNPNCRKPTLGANSKPNKATNIGVAAHICAAAPGGPRYDSTMTEEERKSSENGIWLCQSCAKLIDSDAIRYSKDLLKVWKNLAETTAKLELERPINITFIDKGKNAYPNLNLHNSNWFEFNEKHSSFTWQHSKIDEFCKVTEGSIILVSGYTDVGIDMFVQNVIRHNLKAESKVIYFNLKESSNTIVNSMVAAESMVSLDSIRTGALTEEAWQQIAIATNELGQSQMILEPYNSDVPSMASYLLASIKNGNADIVVIDDLDGLNIENTSFFYQLRSAVNESGTIVLVLADITDMPKRTDKRPIINDTPICKISKFCDIIQLLYYNEDDYFLSSSESRVLELIVAKNYSSTQSEVFYLAQLRKYSKIVEFEHTEKDSDVLKKYPGVKAGVETFIDCLKNL